MFAPAFYWYYTGSRHGLTKGAPVKILITGSTGFVGGTIGRFAAGVGHEVLGVSRAMQANIGWPGKYLAADVGSADLSPAIRDFAPDAVFHAAETPPVEASFTAPLEDLRASLLSWANLLESVRQSGKQPLILYPSSAAVYGQLKKLPVGEDAMLLPISPYGFHKAACELLAREYATCFDQRITVCRFFSLFGESQRRLLIWELFCQMAGPEDIVWLQGTGEETRDYLYEEDMAAAVLLLIESQAENVVPNNIRLVNVASGVEIGVLELAKQMRSLIAPKKEIHCHGTQRRGDPKRWQADISYLRSLAPSWKPRPLAKGLASCVAAWQKGQSIEPCKTPPRC